MKNKAEILLLKNKLRLMKGTIRHTWQGIISVVIVGGVLMYQFFFVIAQAGYGTGATERGVFYTLLLVAAINSFRVFLNQTPAFRVEAASVFMPLLDDPAITRVIGAFCTTTALSGLYQLLIKQAKTVSDKRKQGLSLPFTTNRIVVSYGMTIINLNLLLTLAISLLYTTFSMRLILLFFAEVVAYLVPCCTQLYETEFQRGATTLSNALLFAAVYFLLMT